MCSVIKIHETDHALLTTEQGILKNKTNGTSSEKLNFYIIWDKSILNVKITLRRNLETHYSSEIKISPNGK
jgi:hypothetical protein